MKWRARAAAGHTARERGLIRLIVTIYYIGPGLTIRERGVRHLAGVQVPDEVLITINGRRVSLEPAACAGPPRWPQLKVLRGKGRGPLIRHHARISHIAVHAG